MNITDTEILELRRLAIEMDDKFTEEMCDWALHGCSVSRRECAQRPAPDLVTAPHDGELRKRCSCCSRWLKWDELPSKGQTFDGVEQIDWADCPHCRSTLCLVLWVDVAAYHREQTEAA